MLMLMGFSVEALVQVSKPDLSRTALTPFGTCGAAIEHPTCLAECPAPPPWLAERLLNGRSAWRGSRSG
jgi:hypothetical protein